MLSVLMLFKLVLHLMSVEALQVADILLKLFRCSVLLLSSASSATESKHKVVDVVCRPLIMTGTIVNLSLYKIHANLHF